jgi:hypothetical protein
MVAWILNRQKRNPMSHYIPIWCTLRMIWFFICLCEYGINGKKVIPKAYFASICSTNLILKECNLDWLCINHRLMIMKQQDYVKISSFIMWFRLFVKKIIKYDFWETMTLSSSFHSNPLSQSVSIKYKFNKTSFQIIINFINSFALSSSEEKQHQQSNKH